MFYAEEEEGIINLSLENNLCVVSLSLTSLMLQESLLRLFMRRECNGRQEEEDGRQEREYFVDRTQEAG